MVDAGSVDCGQWPIRKPDDNHTGARYPALFVDGRLGAQSLGALDSFLTWRGQDGATVLLRALNGLQAARYLEITEANKSQRRFLFGWIKERVAM